MGSMRLITFRQVSYKKSSLVFCEFIETNFLFLLTPKLAYYNLVGYTLAQSSTACRYRVQYAFEEIENMITNNQTSELQNALNLCDPVDTTSVYEVAMLLERFIEMITKYIDLFQLVNPLIF